MKCLSFQTAIEKISCDFQHNSISVRRKSSPLASSGSPEIFASSVGEAISKIQRCRMIPLAKFAPSHAGNFDLFRIHRHNFNLQTAQKKVELAAPHFATTGFDHHAALKNICR